MLSKKIKNNIKYIFLVTIILSLPVWFFLILPKINSIPKNFSYQANIVSVDNFYDENIGYHRGEQYSKTEYSFNVIDNQQTYFSIRNLFNVESLDGKPIFKSEPIYKVDSKTWKNLNDVSYKEAYLFAPRFSDEKTQFYFWHPSSNKPLLMVFDKEDELYGLKVLKFKKSNNEVFDQTEFMGFLPGVPEYRGVKLASEFYIWVEPASGYLVKVEDYSTDYYFYDIKTGERLNPYNKFINSYSEESVEKHSGLAKYEKYKILISYICVPFIFILIIFYLLLNYFNLGFASRLFLKNRALIFNFFVIILITIFAGLSFVFSKNYFDNLIRENLDIQSQEVRQLIERRFSLYQAILLGGRGLFDASDKVSRDEWRMYYESLNVNERFPGMQGLGYSVIISPESVESVEKEIRAEGYTDFKINPSGKRDFYTSIVYLEPQSDRNKRAFGYDMYTEPVRRFAMDKARDTGNPVLSGKVVLKQETEENTQPGFLVYVPVYQKNKDLSALESKRQNILGFVYSPFRVFEFMNGILGSRVLNIDFHIYDGLKISRDSKMYDHADGLNEDVRGPGDVIFRKIETIYLLDHPWTVEYLNLKGYQGSFLYTLIPWLIGISVFFAVLMIYITIYSLLRSRKEAVVYANKVTEDLKKNFYELERTKNATINILEDVANEKKRADGEKDKLSTIINTIADAVIVMDVNFKIVLANSNSLLFSNGKNTNLLGLSFLDLFKLEKDDNSEFSITDYFKNVSSLKTSQILPVHVVAVSRDTKIPISGVASPLVNKDGIIEGIVLVLRDITDLYNIDRAKTEFVSLASHQLKTPVGAVKWNAEMLLAGDYGELSDKQKEVVQEVYNLNSRMNDLVKDFLNISRIEMGTFVISPIPTNYFDACDEVLNELKDRIIDKGHSIVKNYQVNMPLKMADPKLLRIVFQNLISNAIKYTNKGGIITIGISSENDKISISVSDNGIMIPENEQNKIFTKLFRATGAQDMDPNGNGLGLYLLKSIVESAGGNVSFKSTKENTEFVVSFPFEGMKARSGVKSLD